MSRKILFVINHAAFFVSHRLPLALAARRRGHQVELVTGQPGSAVMERSATEVLRKAQIAHTRVSFTASGTNPLAELKGVLQLTAYLRKAHADLVHCASPKALLYGGIAARLARVPNIVLAVSGMGFASTDSGAGRSGRLLIAFVYRTLSHLAYGHPNKRVIVQNEDDLNQVIESGLASSAEVVLIPGSGVDVSRLGQAPIERKEPIVLFPARILVDKGALDFIAAARLVRESVPGWRFVMAGAADYDNPSAVSRTQLEACQREGSIEWLGHVDDMETLYARSSIVCLPSYREGLPKALLEAAAAGCAVVTTDTTGCREAIVPGSTGELVPLRSPDVLARVLKALIEDRQRREKYGRAGRQRAIETFSIETIVERNMALYSELWGNARRHEP